MAGRRQNVFYTHVHPCYLIITLTGHDQTILIHSNSKISSLAVPLDNFLHDRISIFHKFSIFRSLVVFIYCQNEQKRCINGIVTRIFCSFREQIRHQTLTAICHKSLHNTFCRFKLSCSNTASGQCDHRVSAPVFKEGEACQNRLTLGGFTIGNELICAECQHLCHRIIKSRLFVQTISISDHILDNIFYRR